MIVERNECYKSVSGDEINKNAKFKTIECAHVSVRFYDTLKLKGFVSRL